MTVAAKTPTLLPLEESARRITKWSGYSSLSSNQRSTTCRTFKQHDQQTLENLMWQRLARLAVLRTNEPLRRFMVEEDARVHAISLAVIDPDPVG